MRQSLDKYLDMRKLVWCPTSGLLVNLRYTKFLSKGTTKMKSNSVST